MTISLLSASVNEYNFWRQHVHIHVAPRYEGSTLI
jgi:diadenosine tetraphosphate (Ap4A) HIT family hydrolase